MAVRIVTDSTSDFSPQAGEELGITVVPVMYDLEKRSIGTELI